MREIQEGMRWKPEQDERIDAWHEVWNLCVKLGMDRDDEQTGLGCVLRFIRKHAGAAPSGRARQERIISEYLETEAKIGEFDADFHASCIMDRIAAHVADTPQGGTGETP